MILLQRQSTISPKTISQIKEGLSWILAQGMKVYLVKEVAVDHVLPNENQAPDPTWKLFSIWVQVPIWKIKCNSK